VRVWGYGASWLDFVRRCVAAEVEYTSPGAKNPYQRASNNLRFNGGETGEDDKLRLALGFPHNLFVSKLDGPTVGPGGAITWPFRGAYLLPEGPSLIAPGGLNDALRGLVARDAEAEARRPRVTV
jgi:hypothetical protein